jgi:toxin-antitoxin system PIN domain toxin
LSALPDVNVLIALVWESHLHHALAREWFAALTEPWLTCSITQTGFVRVSSNTKVLPEAISVQEARAVVASLSAHPQHEFLVDDVEFANDPGVYHERLVGHRQVTDAHLVALAAKHSARLITLDRGVASLARANTSVEILEP